MTIKPTTMYYVNCDGGCPNILTMPNWSSEFSTEEDAQEAANNSDWRSGNGEHWCPTCQALPHEHRADDDAEPEECSRCGEYLDTPEVSDVVV